MFRAWARSLFLFSCRTSTQLRALPHLVAVLSPHQADAWTSETRKDIGSGSKQGFKEYEEEEEKGWIGKKKK